MAGTINFVIGGSEGGGGCWYGIMCILLDSINCFAGSKVHVAVVCELDC
jgi:hypothetical protein